MKGLGNDSRINAFEYALIEAINTPNEFYAYTEENENPETDREPSETR